jgi:RNA polymerase sigma-70 factor (ECF subfamily)
MTVAHRRAVDRVRTETARSKRDQQTTVEPCRSRPFDQVAETVIDSDEQHRVRQCLDHLTALQGQSIQLAYYAGKTCHEIAEELQVPVNTVKSRIHAGLHRLGECLVDGR